MNTRALVLPVLGLVCALGAPPIHSFKGAAVGDRFGASVAGAGDVDCDGCDDVIVGAPHADGNGPSSGSVSVFSGRDGSLLFYTEGAAAGDWLGFSVDGAGDVDRDGCDDIVIGSPLGASARGGARVVSGRTGAVLWNWLGEAPGDRFGHAVSGVGDVDGDGYPDIAVGAPHADVAGTHAGRAYVFSGADGSMLHTLDGAAWDQLGASVAGAGDVDGDGLADVLIGAPFADDPAFNAGAAFVLSGRDGAVIRVFRGAQAGDRLGSIVAAAGDVDGDGTPDLLLGIPADDGAAIDAGAVEVRSGSDGALLLVWRGTKSGEFLQAGAGVGDVDGDGYDDVLVGSSSADGKGSEAGRAWLVSGRTGLELRVFEGRRARDWFGATVAGAGDVNGDGRLDLIVGAPGHDDDPAKAGYALVH